MTRSIGRFSGWISGPLAVMLLIHLWWRSANIDGLGGPYFNDLAGTAAIFSHFSFLGVYFILHSYFASQRFQKRFRGRTELGRRVFLALNLSCVFLVWIYWTPVASPVLWNITSSFRYLLYLSPIIGMIGSAWTYKALSLSAFLGSENDKPILEANGPFQLCRHPSYFFGFFLIVSPYMPLGRATIAIAVIVYILIGSRLEEQKLVETFGSSYERYRKQTPWILPTLNSIRRAFKRQIAHHAQF